MTPRLKRREKPDPEKTYIAIEPIAGETRTVKQGDELHGSDPFVSGNFRSFVASDVPPEERPTFWHLVDDPVPEEPHVIIPPAIAPRRQVQSKVNV